MAKARRNREIAHLGLALGLFIDKMATPAVDGIVALRYSADRLKLGTWSDC